jgi:MFS transporter, PAT family, solute carrier family 33 (acetyl-CoA transportor), member 1
MACPYFSQKWGVPVLSLGTYLRFWSIICFSVTIWLTFFQKEVYIYLVPVRAIDRRSYQRKEIPREGDTSITGVYKTIWSIVKLKRRVFSLPFNFDASNWFQMSNLPF